MKILIMKKQKVQRLVISICLLLFCNYNNAQTEKDDYILLNMVVELTKNIQDSTYHLLKHSHSGKEKLERYYRFRYFDEPMYRIIDDYDEKNDSLNYDNKENQKKHTKKWTIKYAIMDSLFTQKDIEYILKQKMRYDWNSEKIEGNINISIVGNGISNPFYSLNGKLALVIHGSLKTHTSFFFFKKENGLWVNVGSVKNISYW